MSLPMDNSDNGGLHSAMSNSPVVAAVKRYMALLEQGDAPNPDQYCLEFPEIADELRPCLANQSDKKELGEPGRPPRDIERGPPGFQPELPPEEDRFRSPPNGPPPNRRGPRFGQTLFSSQTAKTVERIIAILTPKQHEIWKELVGKPFEFPDF